MGTTAEPPGEDRQDRTRIRTLVDWVFRSRVDGRIVVAQFPNIPLGIFLVATVVRVVLHPAGRVGTVLRIVMAGSLLGWAADEVVRGVNPWRRFLGAVVAGTTVAGLVLH
jgi:hypothetical protein